MSTVDIATPFDEVLHKRLHGPQKSQQTVRSTFEGCPIIDLSVRGQFMNLSVDS